jgi:hypothetical protein
MKWWLVAVFLTRMDAYGTESMEQCHAILQSAERSELRLLPAQLSDNLLVEGAVDLTCLDNETMMQLANGTFGNMPKNIGPSIQPEPEETLPATASDPRALENFPHAPELGPEGTDGPDDRQSDPELSPDTPKTNSPLPYPEQPPFWKLLPKSPTKPPVEAYNKALVVRSKPLQPPQPAMSMPVIGSHVVLDDFGNPMWLSGSKR